MNNNVNNTSARTPEELIDRYVYAVVRRLPLSMRNDVDRELHSIISDTLEARCGDSAPEEKDVKVVLTELGTPSELSAKYDPNGERSLISPKYFPTYYMVLKICLICTLAGLCIAGIINLIIDPSIISLNSGTETLFSGIGQLFGKVLGILISSVISVFGGVTLIFAFMEYKDIELDNSSDDLSRLPAVPQKSAVIKRSECVAGIVFSTLFLILMCFAPQLIAVYNYASPDGARTVVPILNAELVKGMWPIWVAFFVLGAGRDLCKMFIGSYNRRTLVVTLFCDVLSAVLVCFAFLPKNIMNPELLGNISNIISSSGETLDAASEAVINSFFRGFNYIFFGAMIFALLVDIVTAAVKAAIYSDNSPASNK